MNVMESACLKQQNIIAHKLQPRFFYVMLFTDAFLLPLWCLFLQVAS